ncbi:MAG: hypothetical protein IJH78_07260, partial [Clostridia bacterium]|nr:hypothetical protein [Clostridia bacterium]
EEYLDENGDPTRNAAHVYATSYEYDGQGRQIRITTLDRQGRPYNGRRSYAVTEYSYDAAGTRTAAYYSASGRAVR